MTTLDTLNAALQARRGLNYFSEFDAYTDALTAAIVEVGAGLVATSVTEATIGTGAKTLTVQAEKNFAAGQYVNAYQTGTPANYMLGVVDSYNQETGALAFTVAAGDTGGSGTISTWTVVLSGRKGATGATGPIASGTLTGSVDADGHDITDIGALSAATGTITDLTSTTATVTDLTVSDTATIDFASVAAAGEAAEGNPTNVSGDVVLQATGAPVLRHTLTGDTVYKIAGAPTPGHGWSVEVRTTQDGTGSRDLAILPANLLLNTATLSTQAVSVEATAHTLSFYGTGTVTLSGVSTAGPLVGTGANDRVTLSFTPTAGSLTLTVSGTVTKGQLVAGSDPLGYIAVGASRTSTYRITADEIDDASDAAAAEHRRVISAGSDGEILVDVADLES